VGTQFPSKRGKTKYAAYAAIYVLVVIAIIATANVLANRYDKSYDTTANKRYSLSDQTVKIVKGLKQDATITYFDQPRGFRAAKDQLDLYSNLSPKVHVKYVDADKENMLAREAGIKNYGTAHRSNWRQQAGSQRPERRGHYRGLHSRFEEHPPAPFCFVTGSGEHQIDDSGPQRLFAIQGIARQG